MHITEQTNVQIHLSVIRMNGQSEPLRNYEMELSLIGFSVWNEQFQNVDG